MGQKVWTSWYRDATMLSCLCRTDDPLVRQNLARAYSHVEIMRFRGLRLLAALAAGRDSGPGASLNKPLV